VHSVDRVIVRSPGPQWSPDHSLTPIVTRTMRRRIESTWLKRIALVFGISRQAASTCVAHVAVALSLSTARPVVAT
jgi:hypothetical protein